MKNKDCGVKAVSIACRVPYDKAHDACRLAGRKNCHGMWESELLKAIRITGCTHEEIDWVPRQKNGSRYTTKTIGQKYPKGFYIVWVRGHILAMVDGKVLDWTDGRKHRVVKVWKITAPRGSKS